MKQHSKFQQREQEQAATTHQQETQQNAREFASAEELLRADAAQVEVPPDVAKRLNKSVEGLPPPAPRSWWQRLFDR